MKVKNKLSLQFTLMFAMLLLMVLAGVYFIVEHNRVKTFFDKLDDRAITVAQFYLAEDNLSKEHFKNVLKKYPQSLSGEVIRIYDSNYQPKFIRKNYTLWTTAVLKQVVAKKKNHLFLGDRQATGLYYIDNSGDYIIMVSASDIGGHNDMHKLRLIMLLLFLLSLLITFLTGRIFSRFALWPIVHITNDLKTLRASSLDLRLPVEKSKPDEIDNLSLTINQVLEHLEQSFDNQQSFVANASHELRTPITTILGEAETTIMRERESADYKLALKNIIKECEKLDFIINGLMELIQTNIENKDFQSLRIDELLWEIKDEFLGRLPENENIIKYNLLNDPAKCTLFGNKQLLIIGISNVLKNAIKFSDFKEVYCELACDANGVNILIRDQGIGINNNDLTKIFQPFFRSTNALKYSGHGIGLSLTQNIIRLHNGVINIKSEINKGTEVHIILPSSN